MLKFQLSRVRQLLIVICVILHNGVNRDDTDTLSLSADICSWNALQEWMLETAPCFVSGWAVTDRLHLCNTTEEINTTVLQQHKAKLWGWHWLQPVCRLFQLQMSAEWTSTFLCRPSWLHWKNNPLQICTESFHSSLSKAFSQRPIWHQDTVNTVYGNMAAEDCKQRHFAS